MPRSHRSRESVIVPTVRFLAKVMHSFSFPSSELSAFSMLTLAAMTCSDLAASGMVF